jgi:hypothetical protein
MMKKFIIPIAIVLGLALYVSTACSEDEYSVFKVDAFPNLERPVSVFGHDAHMEMEGIEGDCTVCHHVYEDGVLLEGESSEDSACSDCHGLEPEGDKPGLMNAYHTQCKTCHEEQGMGPITCGECHVR